MNPHIGTDFDEFLAKQGMHEEVTAAAVKSLTPIQNEADYRAALKQAEAFFNADEEPSPDSPQGAYFDALVTLIEAYEREHYPMAA